MPWKEVNCMDQKIKFIIRSFDPNENFSQLCSEFGITNKTGYKWKNRFIQGGEPALVEQSRKPKSNKKQVAEDIVCEIVKIKTIKKAWGPKKIHAVYMNNHPNEKIPSVSTVERVLKKSGLTQKKKRTKSTIEQRIQNHIQAKNPNDLWTVDFKGWWYTTEKEKCEPLTVRDDFSKFILAIEILEKGDIFYVKQHFIKLFNTYGLPKMIRSDNGPPFASNKGILGLTKLATWWLSLGISLDRIDPGKPSQNGSHERMHADMMRELESKIHGDLKTHQSIFNVWRKEFNEERPHESLKMKTPASLYKKSSLKYYDDFEFRYPKEYHVRSINDRGYLRHKGRRIFISNAFNGFKVGLNDQGKNEIEVHFAQLKLGNVNLKENLFTVNDEFVKDKKRTKVLPMS